MDPDEEGAVLEWAIVGNKSTVSIHAHNRTHTACSNPDPNPIRASPRSTAGPWKANATADRSAPAIVHGYASNKQTYLVVFTSMNWARLISR